MLLRLRGPDGMVRLDVSPSETFGRLGLELMRHLPSTVDPKSITMSNAPTGGDSKRLADIAHIQIGRIGLNHGDMIFLTYEHAKSNGQSTNGVVGTQSASSSAPVSSTAIPPPTTAGMLLPSVPPGKKPWEVVKQAAIDDRLDQLDGKIPRRPGRMCRHGPKGMCDYCQPLDPFDSEYLREKNIKYLSFHSHLRKINSATNRPERGTSFIPPLAEPYFRVRPDCPAGHAPWPEGICTKCQPSTVGLQPQTFRMVDHVEFSSPSLIDGFINAWRKTGGQRLGYLFGRYVEYAEVPLGIKAVVEVVYEPPQLDESDGITLIEPWEAEAEVRRAAGLCGLELVGVIWTDLLDAGRGDGSVVCRRHADSYFLSGLEVAFSARLQARHPNPTKWSDTGRFGSRFVTCVVSANETAEIAISTYQMSNEAVEMVTADLIEPSADPSLMLIRPEEEEVVGEENRPARRPATRYVPEIYYRKINKYGLAVQENAKPAFPVEYLFVALTHGFPENPNPAFTLDGFPFANREFMGESQEHVHLATALGVAGGQRPPGHQPVDVSNFQLVCFVIQMGILSKDEEALLCRAATSHDPADSLRLRAAEGWQTLEMILQSTG